MPTTVATELPANMDLRLDDCRNVLPGNKPDLSRIQPGSVHLVITDPPYRSDQTAPQRQSTSQDFMEAVASMMLSALKPGGFAAVFCQPRLEPRIAVALEEAGFEIRDLCAWHFTRHTQYQGKRQLHESASPPIQPQFESVILAQKPRAGTFLANYLTHSVGLIDASATLDGKAPSNMMTVPKDPETSKPVRLIEHLIKLLSEPGQVVLDPFLGDGTTVVAARRTGRSCIGIEINPDRMAIAAARLREPEPPDGWSQQQPDQCRQLTLSLPTEQVQSTKNREAPPTTGPAPGPKWPM